MLIGSWEGENSRVWISLNKKRVRVGLQETNNFFFRPKGSGLTRYLSGLRCYLQLLPCLPPLLCYTFSAGTCEEVANDLR